ncbi:hypothetical protein IME11_2 [Escherichia phage IME11]|uniref:Uncharacterized protein n=1 Tax=Escherichia phage IME11 TaxID=1239384 RepID=K4MPX1_9CAUD|nr:hypothetical protein IME11_2 [Escherichia phage IME11]AFV29051.1 hypothetical protein IME11_2 [Escherichia phage IME11]
MALKFTFDFNGITVNDGVLTVSKPMIDGESGTITFGLLFQATSADPLLKSVTLSCPYDPFGADPFTQAYAYIKSLPDYESAEEI